MTKICLFTYLSSYASCFIANLRAMPTQQTISQIDLVASLCVVGERELLQQRLCFIAWRTMPEGSLPLLSLNHISRVVRDVEASIKFYTEVSIQ